MCPLLKIFLSKTFLTNFDPRQTTRAGLSSLQGPKARFELTSNLVCLGFNLRDVLARFFFGRRSLPARSRPQHIFHADVFRCGISTRDVRRSLSRGLAR